MFRRRAGHVLVAVNLALLTVVVGFASGPSDAAVNPIDGGIELADTSWDGTQDEVRRVVNRGGGKPPKIDVLTSNAVDDREPRLAISG
ncbi:MAG: hypothetical protein JSV80_17960 [Acidobacteriota bacterium]|nr:MAG: hypothetical protein JSV80_17960 [Acidobacteriota bacterium]